MRQRSVMRHNFALTPPPTVPRAVFDLSHGYQTTFDAGYLIPILAYDQIIPGDTWNLKCNVLIRLLSPTVAPVMDNMFYDVFAFFVPKRLLWNNFKKFMGEQATPASSISFTNPQVTWPDVAAGGIAVNSLGDYLAYPTGALSGGGATTGITTNAFKTRAYNLVWNHWFRSQNLQDSVTVDLGDGPDTSTNYTLLRRGKRFDYFTMANPFVQKGTAVTLPLGTSATVVAASSNTDPFFSTTTGGGPGTTNLQGTAGTNPVTMTPNAVNTTTMKWGNVAGDVGLIADLSTATSATINALRESVTLQQFLERDARGGTRYPEIVKSHFGVTNPDSRVQVPELLSIYSNRLNVTPVAWTAPASVAGDSDLEEGAPGKLGGYAVDFSKGNGFVKSFTEHGTLLVLLSARADLRYQQGLDRENSLRTRYDEYWPDFAGLGEQAILNQEIYANLADNSTSTGKTGTWGYVPRYEHLRFITSKVTGLLRSTAASNIDEWTLAQEFTAQPTLGNTFIQDDPPIDRVIAVPSQPHFVVDVDFDIKAARPIPVFGVPGVRTL